MPFVPSARKRLSNSAESVGIEDKSSIPRQRTPVGVSTPSITSQNNTRPFSTHNRHLSDSSIEGDIPLSISFMRRPSRSTSMDQDIEQIMKVNTLLNTSHAITFDNRPINESENNGGSTSSESSKESSYFPKISERSSFDNDDTSPISMPSSPTMTEDSKYSYLHPLVRKKSGELVKSSLKLNSLGSSRSLPSTPTYKQVHFGGTDDVKFFNDADKPCSISANNSPSVSDDEDSYDDSDYHDSVDEYGDDYYGHNFQSDDRYAVYHTIYKVSKDCVTNNRAIDIERFKRLIKSWNLDTGLFPKVSYRDEIDKETPVFLERCFLNVEKTEVMGQIAVKNISFHKSVTLRYSFDDWKTVINSEATYIPEIPRLLKKANYDRFVFKIDVPMLFSQFSSSHKYSIGFDPYFLMCIRYVTDNQEFWDNNYHQNYKLSFVREGKHTKNNNSHSPKSHRNTKSSPSHSYSSKYLRKTRSMEDTSFTSSAEDTSPSLAPFSLNEPPTPRSSLSAAGSTDSTATLVPIPSPTKEPSDHPSNDKDLRLLLTPSKNYDTMFKDSNEPSPSSLNGSSMNSPGTPLILKDASNAPTFTDLMPPSSAQRQKDLEKLSTSRPIDKSSKKMQPPSSKPGNNASNVIPPYNSLRSVPMNNDSGSLSPNSESVNKNEFPFNSNSSTGDKAPIVKGLKKNNVNDENDQHAFSNNDSAISDFTGDPLDDDDNADAESGINSKSYQDLLKKYCFFQSPSTVSSFLESNLSEDTPINKYGHSFY